VPVLPARADDTGTFQSVSVSVAHDQRPAGGPGSGVDAKDTHSHTEPLSTFGQKLVVDIEIGPHILYVFVIVERLHQTDHLLGGLSFEAGGA
jgi:hypothetical protein